MTSHMIDAVVFLPQPVLQADVCPAHQAASLRTRREHLRAMSTGAYTGRGRQVSAAFLKSI